MPGLCPAVSGLLYYDDDDDDLAKLSAQYFHHGVFLYINLQQPDLIFSLLTRTSFSKKATLTQ